MFADSLVFSILTADGKEHEFNTIVFATVSHTQSALYTLVVSPSYHTVTFVQR